MNFRHFLPKTPKNRFTQFGQNFSTYIANMRKVISNGRLDLTTERAREIINENSPFELNPEQPNNKAIILTHGLYDSPFSMRDLGEHFVKQGYLVRAPLLPGHGTVPGDLLRIHSRDWLETLRFTIDQTHAVVDEIILCGFSLGGALSIILHRHSPKIKAVIGLAPALKPLHPFADITRIHTLFTWISEKAKFYIQNRALISHVKYFSHPYNAAKHGTKMMAYARKTPMTVPIFFVMSEHDETIKPNVVLKYFTNQPQPENRLIYYTNTSASINDQRILVRSSTYPEHNIIDFSHSCIPIAPENHFLGYNGEFVDYVHYENLEHPEELQYRVGAITPENLMKYRMQRLNYNPDFHYMTQQIDKFIASLSD